MHYCENGGGFDKPRGLSGLSRCGSGRGVADQGKVYYGAWSICSVVHLNQKTGSEVDLREPGAVN